MSTIVENGPATTDVMKLNLLDGKDYLVSAESLCCAFFEINVYHDDNGNLRSEPNLAKDLGQLSLFVAG